MTEPRRPKNMEAEAKTKPVNCRDGHEATVVGPSLAHRGGAMSEIPRPNEWEMRRSAEELAQVNLDGGLNTADRRYVRAMARRAYHAELDLATVTEERDRLLRHALGTITENLIKLAEIMVEDAPDDPNAARVNELVRALKREGGG